MSLFDLLKRDKVDVVIAQSHNFSQQELENYLQTYSPWIVVDKLKAKQLDESDFNWMKIIIARAYQEGFEEGIKLERDT